MKSDLSPKFLYHFPDNTEFSTIMNHNFSRKYFFIYFPNYKFTIQIYNDKYQFLKLEPVYLWKDRIYFFCHLWNVKKNYLSYNFLKNYKFNKIYNN